MGGVGRLLGWGCVFRRLVRVRGTSRAVPRAPEKAGLRPGFHRPPRAVVHELAQPAPFQTRRPDLVGVPCLGFRRAWAQVSRCGLGFRRATWAGRGAGRGLAKARDVGWQGGAGTWAFRGGGNLGLQGGRGTWAAMAWDLGFQGARGTAREAPPGLWTPDNLSLPTPARAEPAAGHGGFPPTVGHPRSRPSPPAVGQSRAQRNRGTLTSVWARSLGEGSVHSAPAAVVLGRAPLVHPAEWMT